MRDCYDTCLIESEVVNGKIKVKGSKLNPITNGFLCPKGQMFPKWVHSKDRLRKPLVRKNGKLVEVSWEEAVNVVAEKIREFVESGKAHKILVYQYAGDRGVVNYYFPMRLFHFIGASFLDRAICDRAGQEALKSVYGTAIGMDPEDLRGRNLIVYWGMNPFWTNLHGFQLAKRLGLEIWSVDVYRTQTVKRSDRSFILKPGSDPEFALAVLKVMLENGWYDERAESLEGFEKLRNSLKDLDLEDLARKSGVSVEDVNTFAREFHGKRGVVHLGYGFQRGRRGGESVLAVSLIPLLSNYDCSFIYDMKVLKTEYAEGRFLRSEPLRLIPQMEVADYVERGEIEMIYVYNSNPVSTLQNSRRIERAFKDVFLVVHDIFLTDTAKIADVVLPASTFFERFDIADSYYHLYVSINEPVLRIAGKSNREAAMMIAKALGIDEPHLYESEESVIRKVVEDTGLDYEELLRKKILKGEKLQNCSASGSKLWNEKIEKLFEEVGNLPEGELLMITPTHQMTVSSQYQNTYGIYDPFVHVSPEDARRLNLKDGDEVFLKGSSMVKVKVKIDPDVPKGLVVGYKAFWKSITGWNVNELVPDGVQEEYGKASIYHHFPVEIFPAS